MHICIVAITFDAICSFLVAKIRALPHNSDETTGNYVVCPRAVREKSRAAFALL